MWKINSLTIVVIALVLFGCKEAVDTNEPIINVSKVPENGVVLNKWQLLGPFLANGQVDFIKVDNLELYGYKESTITLENFIKIPGKSLSITNKLDTCFTNSFISTGDYPFEFEKMPKFSTDINGNYYFACEIRCKENISTRFHFSSNGFEKVWLNNKLICEDFSIKPIISYRKFIPISLKKGNNFLLIKIQVPNKKCEIYARLENKTLRGMERALGVHNHGILSDNIIKESDSIRQSAIFLPSNGEITVYDGENRLLIKDSLKENKLWSHSIKGFKDGNYIVKAKIEDFTLVQDIYIGDIIDSTKEIINKLQFIETTNKIRNNIGALSYRFNHLLKNTYLTDKKFVNLFIQLRDIYVRLKEGNDPFKHTTGSFIRSYVSEIDSSLQYYILHIPSSYKRGEKIPVATAVPVNVYDKLIYLESFRVANNKLVDYFQDLSEKYNMIIIEPGSRRKNEANHNPIEETEFFSILNDVEADYDIDRDRIYLAGTCSGGNELFKMSIKYPDLFAAVGVVAPDIVYVNENTNPWMKTNYPIMFLSNNRQLPIFDTHSIIDRHVPIESSENLNKVAEYYQLENFNYVKIPNEFPRYYPDDFYDDILKFTRNYSLDRSPQKIDLTTNQMLYNKSFWVTINDMNIPSEAHIQAQIKGNKLTVQKENVVAYSIDLTTMPYNKKKPLKVIDNGLQVFNGMTRDSVLYLGVQPKANVTLKNNRIAGPLAHVFSQRFILVKGTSGSRLESEGIKALADTINKYWYNRYFTNCITKNDFEISKKDIENSNLVLLGNPSSNLLLKRFQNDISLLVTNTGIQIKDEKVEGEKLCFYMVYPNPINKNRYVAVMGYNNAGFISLGAENSESFNDVSNYGWYDYKVWDADNAMKTLSSGYFDSHWNL